MAKDHSSKSHPGLDRSKKENWVDKVGGLPSYIERIARHLNADGGHSVGTSIAMAINTVKKWCATGKNHNGSDLKPATKAKACKAVAEWEAKKGKSKAKSIAEAKVILHAQAQQHELESMLPACRARLKMAKAALPLLEGRGSKIVAFQMARVLLEGKTKENNNGKVDLAGPEPDPDFLGPTKARLREEIDTLTFLIEAIDPPRKLNLQEAGRGGGAVPPPRKAAGRGPRAGGRSAAAATAKGQPVAARTTDQRAQDTNKDGALTGSELERFNKLHPRASSGPGGGRFIAKGEGMEGEPSDRVRQLQQRMSQLGYQTNPDGRFGPVTQAAVRRFQQRNGASVDGVVGPQTVEAMRRAQREDQVDPDLGGGETRGGRPHGDAERDDERGGDGQRGGEPRRDENGNLLPFHQAGASNRKWARKGREKRAAAREDAEGGSDRSGGRSSGRDGDRDGRSSQSRSERDGDGEGDLLKKGEGMGQEASDTVKELQKFLDELGYELGDAGIDGRFGPDTEAAVKKLQRRYGLKADGIVGPETRALMERLAKRRAKEAAEGPRLTADQQPKSTELKSGRGRISA